ncbi:MAG: tyrosine-type recombinase/integrase [Fuerstiella sp.]|nr:tyrosine-type recombinase/integrase [Fuerstiella sp.]MCP4853944.1 tyrosine-type recombinase/integrase [Fuerstiella sp.]
MGSITKDGKSWRLFYTLPGGSRASVRFKGLTRRQIDSVDRCIDDLIIKALSGQMVETITAQWLATIDQTLHRKLEEWGLVSQRIIKRNDAEGRLGSFLNEFIAEGRTNTGRKVAKLTIRKWKTTASYLIEHFGESCGLEKVSVADAKKFWVWLDNRDGINTENTIRKHIQLAKMFWNAAIDAELVAKNPFRKLPSTSIENKERDYFVTCKEYLECLETCPDLQWRLILTLCRIGGFRCPSELILLTWDDVLWDKKRIIVHSKKTEHHEGKDTRVIPMWPELEEILREVWDEADVGSEYVVTRYRDSGSNLRTLFIKIIKRAGLAPWPKVFQNLRASRETELLDLGHPAHVVAGWMGHAVKVQNRHYAQIADHHFDAALNRSNSGAHDVGSSELARSRNPAKLV